MAAARGILTSRDEAIITMVFSYDGVAIHHIQERFFPTSGARSACYTRIGTLVKAGYLTTARIPSQTGLGTGKAFLTVAARARPLVAKLLNVSPSTLSRGTRAHAPAIIEHHLSICDVRLSFERAVLKSPAFTHVEWTNERILRTRPMVASDEERGEPIALIPDGLLRLTRRDGHTQAFFVEVDRGTITEHKRLVKRLRGYLLHAKDEPTPVLFTVPTTSRQTLLATLAEREAAKLAADPTLFFLTEQSRVNPDSVLTAPIWQVVSVAAPLTLAPDEPVHPFPAQEGAGR